MEQEGQTKQLSLKAAYAFGISSGLAEQVNEIRDLVIEWDLSYTSSLRRGYILELFQKRGLLENFKAAHWAYGNTPAGEAKERFYLRIKQRYEDFLAGRSDVDEAEDLDEEGEEAEQQFAAEADLRDFLAKNLTCIEPGLTLFQSGEKTGVEYKIDGGYIDILAVDRKGGFVVIELKVGRGRNRTVGQLLFYMGWVDNNLGKTPCRGMIIAKDIPDDLRLAVQRVAGVSLFRYHLAVTLEAVPSKASAVALHRADDTWRILEFNSK